MGWTSFYEPVSLLRIVTFGDSQAEILMDGLHVGALFLFLLYHVSTPSKREDESEAVQNPHSSADSFPLQEAVKHRLLHDKSLQTFTEQGKSFH